MSPPLLLLDMAALEQMLSLGHTTIEKLVKAGGFPASGVYRPEPAVVDVGSGGLGGEKSNCAYMRN